MIRYLVDTNVISNATKPEPSPRLAEWWMAQPSEALFVASLTLAEIQRGILLLPAGRKRRSLEDWFVGEAGPHRLFAGRILAFDDVASGFWARLMAEGTRQGRPRNGLDMIVAATALANDCTVVTENERDFAGLTVLNPMRAAN